MLIKCRKCANQLADIADSHVLTVHPKTTTTVTQESQAANDSSIVCPTERENAEVFLHEDHLPPWMNAEIEQSQWTKGKLKCGKCGQKVGSFDFVSGTRCKCGGGEGEESAVLPAVHFVRSKVDLRK